MSSILTSLTAPCNYKTNHPSLHPLSVFSFSESGTVNIVKGNEKATEDEQVEFLCVATAWFPAPSITWTQNGHPVDSSLFNTSSMEDGRYFNATSVFTFKAVNNTTVACQATVLSLTNPVSSSVFLVVCKKLYFIPVCP